MLPLVIDRPGGLVVEVTDGTTDYNASRCRLSVFYDLVPDFESCRPYGSGIDQSVAQCASAVFMTWTNSVTVPWKGSGSHFLR